MISVVVPVLNEQATIAPLRRALEDALAEPHEILFVDDGSTDSTWEEIRKQHAPGRVRGLRLAGHCGKTAALAAAFAAARGDVIFTLDGDLQDDPRDIPRFLAMLDQGCDVVSGWKKVRHDPPGKVLASRLFNGLVRAASGVPLHDVNCGFKAYRAEVARRLPLRSDFHRFTPLLAHAMGYRVGEVVVTHHPRRHGQSHYGFGRLFRGLADLARVLWLGRRAGQIQPIPSAGRVREQLD